MSCSRYSFIGYFFQRDHAFGLWRPAVEIYYMNRDGIPVSTSTPMLMVTTILYKIVLVALGVVFMAVGRDRMLAALSHSLWLFVLGFVLNALFIAFVLALLFKPALVRRFMHWLFGLRPLRRHDKMRERAVAFAEKYHESCELFTSRWKDALAWLLVSLLQRCIYLFLPYLVYRAFGMSGAFGAGNHAAAGPDRHIGGYAAPAGRHGRERASVYGILFARVWRFAGLARHARFARAGVLFPAGGFRAGHGVVAFPRAAEEVGKRKGRKRLRRIDCLGQSRLLYKSPKTEAARNELSRTF